MAATMHGEGVLISGIFSFRVQTSIWRVSTHSYVSLNYCSSAGLDKSSTPGSALVAPGRVRFAQELAVGVSMHVLARPVGIYIVRIIS